MVAEGGLGLEIAWNGKEVTGVTIRSTRPLYLSRVLEGKLAAQAMAMVPLLFSVCGRAQTVAAVRALEAARGIYLTGTISRLREMVVAAECVREHLMRILLDLPPLLGQPALQEPLLRVQRRFEEVRGLLASRPAWWEEQGGARDDLDPWRVLAVDLAGVLASEVLGMGPARFWL